MNEYTTAAVPHRLTLDDREKLTLTGVEDVERFDEDEIVLTTAAGALIIIFKQKRINIFFCKHIIGNRIISAA